MNNENFELENMRQQMTTLKNKLNKQEILNDRIMRRSMTKEVNTITRRYYIIMALCIFMVPYGYWAFVVLSRLSVAFWIATSIIMLICAGATFYNIRKINDPGLMNHSLVEARITTMPTESSGADASEPSSEPSADSHSTSRPSGSIRRLSTRLKTSPQKPADTPLPYQRPLSFRKEPTAAFFVTFHKNIPSFEE